MIGLVASYTACTLAVTLGIVYPYIALLIYVVFAVVKPAEMWFWSLAGTRLSSLVFCGLALGWVLHGFADWRLRYAWMPVLALLWFWGWGWISWCNSTDTSLPPPSTSLYSDYSPHKFESPPDQLLQLAKVILPCVIGITLLDSEKKVLGLLWAMILAQGYVAWEMNVSYLLEGYNRIRLEGFAGLDNNSVAVSLVTCCLPAFIAAYYCSSLWLRVMLTACGLLIIHAILLTFSRGGMIALLVSVATAFLVMKGDWKKWIVLVLVTIVAIVLCGPEVWERFMTIFVPPQELDPAARSRLELWEDCLDVMLRFPWCGVGPDNWPRIAVDYGWPPGKEAHSLWLQTGAELGIPGLLAIVTYYIATGWRLYRWAPTASSLQATRDAVIVGLSGFVVAAQFVSLELLETPYYLALCGLGGLRFAELPRLPRGATLCPGCNLASLA
ncbi:MAG: O-antigen ligase family protein [Gemmatales bacterium]|nr:O-antigen ligase family protein [Gemmatales bacterium]MCS7161366.1 O-antigen ligase family protein [Gemmatales bacterium]MDW8176569.1 O-antigen ligase family protein [Gemmatales bacterium]MDW8221870.1 O-antigen ligase family protein [Gemmatales bacterium]